MTTGGVGCGKEDDEVIMGTSWLQSVPFPLFASGGTQSPQKAPGIDENRYTTTFSNPLTISLDL
jgi:hypothetical protein